MTKDAKELTRAFDLLHEACMTISEAGACESCPLHEHLCLDDYKAIVVDIAEKTAPVIWQKFLDFSDDIYSMEEYMTNGR